MDPTCASWGTIFSGLLTPVIAISVAVIAYRQWRTAQNRLRLDLFDRCLAIHTEALEMISKVVTNQFDAADFAKFEPAVRRAKWLMDKDLERYFKEEFFPKILELQVLWAQGKGRSAGKIGQLLNGLWIKRTCLTQSSTASLKSRFDKIPYLLVRVERDRIATSPSRDAGICLSMAARRPSAAAMVRALSRSHLRCSPAPV